MTFLKRIKPLSAPFLQRIIGEEEGEIEVLQPEEKEVVIPPVLLPGMLERITKTDEHSKLSEHIDAVQATVVTHAPVLRRIYRDACVWPSGYSTWRKLEHYGKKSSLREITKPILQMEELRYCKSYVSWRYFGHWLTDALPTAFIDPAVGEPWLPPDASWTHAFDYMKIFDLPEIRHSFVHTNQLIVYQDFSQGSSKRSRYRIIRNEIHKRFGGEAATDYVYLQRGATGVRRQIKNETKLIEELIARGWKIIDISKFSVEELQRALCRARVVVSMEGSHMTHAQISMHPRSSIIILVPNDRFTSVHIGYARANKISAGIVVLNGTQADAYSADLDEILRTIERVEYRE